MNRTGENTVISITILILGFVGREKRYIATFTLHLLLAPLFPVILGFYIQVSVPSTGGSMPELIVVRIISPSAIQQTVCIPTGSYEAVTFFNFLIMKKSSSSCFQYSLENKQTHNKSWGKMFGK